MSWAIGFDSNWNRDIGYGVPAYCDHPDCDEEIDRGLSYVCCDTQPYGGEGCGLYFCAKHSYITEKHYGLCVCCLRGNKPFSPKPDHHEWVNWKLTDESWEEWRQAYPKEVEKLKQQIGEQA